MGNTNGQHQGTGYIKAQTYKATTNENRHDQPARTRQDYNNQPAHLEQVNHAGNNDKQEKGKNKKNDKKASSGKLSEQEMLSAHYRHEPTHQEDINQPGRLEHHVGNNDKQKNNDRQKQDKNKKKDIKTSSGVQPPERDLGTAQFKIETDGPQHQDNRRPHDQLQTRHVAYAQTQNVQSEVRTKEEQVEQTRRQEKKKTDTDAMETLKKQLQDEMNQRYRNEQELKKLNDELKSVRQNSNDERNRLSALHDQALRSKDTQISSKTRELASLKKEKDQLLIRLSAMAGAKMTDNNPNITDLSDVNRPTKLAEKYTEIYDNAWTDAFAELLENENNSDEEAITILLDSFVKIYEDCKKEADSQLEKLHTAVSPFHMSSEELPEIIKPLKDNRKKCYKPDIKGLETIVNNILQSIPFTENGNKTPVMVFLTNSLELCWLMAIQDPPVFVDCDTSSKKGKPFEKNLFKEYTVSGLIINFVVWPTLYLQEGGAVLCKGVAQGQKKTIDRNGQLAKTIGVTTPTVLKENKLEDFSKSFNTKSSSSSVSTTASIKTEPKQPGSNQGNTFSNGPNTKATDAAGKPLYRMSIPVRTEAADTKKSGSWI